MTTEHKAENTGRIDDEFNEPEKIKGKEFSEKKISSEMSGKYRWKRKLFLLFSWGTFIFIAFLSYPFFKNLHISPVTPEKRRQVRPLISQTKRFPVQSDRSVKFDSFIIPFEDRGKFTYISLSISFESPNKELTDEINKKNTLIRGIIYTILSNNIKILTTVSALEKLKELITYRVNGVLTTGKIDQPIITEFSTV